MIAVGKIKERLFFGIKEVSARFPLVVFFSACVSILCIIHIHGDERYEEILIKMLCISIPMIFASTSIKVMLENADTEKTKYWLFSLLAFVFVCYVVQLSDTHITQMMLHAGLFLSLFYAPFIKKGPDNTTFANYCLSFSMTVITASLMTLFLCGAMIAVFLSVKYLFDINYILGIKIIDLQLDVLSIVGVLFPIFYVLSSIPTKEEFTNFSYSIPKIIKIAIEYVFSPIVIIYLVILYAYAIQIIVKQEIPKGYLSVIAIGFVIAGIVTHVLNFLLQKETKSYLRDFVSKYLYVCLIIPALLLFITIGIRIKEYGITESRYIVLMFAVWLASSIVYMLASKSKDIKTITIVVSAVLMLCSSGFWGAEHISAKSQEARLVSLMNKYGLIRKGIAANVNQVKVPFKDAKNISSVINYLTITKKTDMLEKLFVGIDFVTPAHSSHDVIDKALSRINIEYIPDWKEKEDKFFEYKRGKELLDIISGYDYFAVLKLNRNSHKNIKKTGKDLDVYVKDDKLHIVYNNNNFEFEISELIKQIKSFDTNGENKYVVTDQNENLKIKLIIERIYGVHADGKDKYLLIEFMLLIADKD